MTIVTLKAKPAEIKAILWDGTEQSFNEIVEFVGKDDLGVSRAMVGKVSFDPPRFTELIETGDPLRVWNYLRLEWTVVPFGHWVIRGVNDEYYSCEERDLHEQYDVITNESDPIKDVVLIDHLENIGNALVGEDYIKESQLITYGNILLILAKKIAQDGVA